jgi:hypothetical protein
MTTAIISIEQMRRALAHHRVRGGKRVVLAALDEAKAQALKAGPEQDEADQPPALQEPKCS